MAYPLGLSYPGWRKLTNDDLGLLQPGDILFASETVAIDKLTYIVIAHSYEIVGADINALLVEGEDTKFSLTIENHNLIQRLLTLDSSDPHYEAYKKLYKEKHARGDTRTARIPPSPPMSFFDTLSFLVVISMAITVLGVILAAIFGGC